MEAVESANRWHQWSVNGTGNVLTQVIDGLDLNCPHGWLRLRGEDLKSFQSLVRPGSAWYSLVTTSAYAGVRLSVEQRGDSELRGGRVWFLNHLVPAPAAGISAAWNEVMRFLDEGIVPAARAAGALISVPTPQEMFLGDLPPDVVERLQTFSRLAKKGLPLDRDEAELWQAFVVGAYRARASIDAPRFIDWLVHENWKRADATELNMRFFDQCLLLARYAEEVSAA